LYFLVPQGSRFGLPFLRYATMWPAIMESTEGVFPQEQVRAWRLASAHVRGAGVDFFQWNFSDFVFTLIVQGSFILSMVVMVWRKWRQADAHLLSKGWALLVFTWLCILPIGNAMPGIDDGTLFPARNLRALLDGHSERPRPEEAGIMCVFYGLLMFILLILLVIMLTPALDSQARGLRRASRLGRNRAPLFADESSAFPVVLLLTVAGAASWAWFARSVFGSDWFRADPGLRAFGWFLAIFGPATLAFHALLESRGGKWPFLAAVLFGIVPILAALVVLASSREVPIAAVTIAGASPLAQAGYAVDQLMPWPPRMSPAAARLHGAAGTAAIVWTCLYAVVTVVLLAGLRRHWKQLRRDV
jgi:hypothetical protein